MIGKDELRNFKKMWTWLSGYPAHDRDYYMKYVVKLDKMWVNSCPLSNNNSAEDCDGCKMLWSSSKGTLCTDPDAPVYKWKTAERQQSDDRSFYASKAAVLAMKNLRGLESGTARTVLRRSTVQ